MTLVRETVKLLPWAVVIGLGIYLGGVASKRLPA